MKKELSDGTIVDFTAQEESDHILEHLSESRRKKIEATKDEALRRIALEVEAIESIAMVGFMVEIWPMLNTASASASLLKARDIYLYAKTKIAESKSATQTQIDAYDPVADTGWPQ